MRAAVFIAGAFTGMLRWWMHRGLQEDWREIDRAFKAMVEAGLGPSPGRVGQAPASAKVVRSYIDS